MTTISEKTTDMQTDTKINDDKLIGQPETVGEQLGRESLIIVNGRQRKIKGNIVSFEEAVKIAFPSGPSRPDIKYSVTYGNALKPHRDGELDPGQKVVVKPGRKPHEETSFCVTETILS